MVSSDGPMSQRKAVHAEFLELAARRAIFLPDFDRMTRPGQADGRRKSAQAGADDEDFFHSFLKMSS